MWTAVQKNIHWYAQEEGKLYGRQSSFFQELSFIQITRTYANEGSVKLFWRPEVDENWAIMVVQPAIFTHPTMVFLLLTCSTGPMEWSTGNSYQAEALTNVLRYHTCRLSHSEDRKLPITELKWDARTVTDIPGNNAYWFFAFFWLTKGSRNKN